MSCRQPLQILTWLKALALQHTHTHTHARSHPGLVIMCEKNRDKINVCVTVTCPPTYIIKAVVPAVIWILILYCRNTLMFLQCFCTENLPIQQISSFFFFIMQCTLVICFNKIHMVKECRTIDCIISCLSLREFIRFVWFQLQVSY